jgi:CRISPR-associated endonuclease Cas1
MAASHTLSHSFAIPQISKLGVLTLFGYGIRITMQSGHLQIEDGIGPERRKFRLPRVNHRLKRLVCIGEDGFITLSALRWLSEVGASFAMLDRVGKVRVVTGPVSPSEAKLRRAQATALIDGRAVPIARELVAAKLIGHESVLRDTLIDIPKSDSLAALRKRLDDSETIDSIRAIESHAAMTYWSAWYDIPIIFPHKDTKQVPDHWLKFGTRHSPISGSPRLAVNPPNALLNYINAIAESECRKAAVACGLDPGLGFVHTDTANRDSLALDLIETIRPAIEAWLLNWLLTEPLTRADFSESSDGNCRITTTLCSKLGETAPTWGKLVGPWAEYVAHSLYAGRSSRSIATRGLKTPLTQRHRRKAKGSAIPIARIPKADHVCRGCGKFIREERKMCATCSIPDATNRLLQVSKMGRLAAKGSRARAKHTISARKNVIACNSWQSSNHPKRQTKEFFSKEIQPKLINIPTREIVASIGISRWYAGKIRKGYIPHARHWGALAELASHSMSG